MIWQDYPYALPNLILAATLALLAIYVKLRRGTQGAKAFTVLMLGLSLWSLGYGFELAHGYLLEVNFWVMVKYGGMVIVPGAWLVFTQQ